MTLTTKQIDRFYESVAKAQSAEECWPWTGYKQRTGYGMFTAGPVGPGHKHRAHRVAFELANGPVPAGMVIDHLCRNRLCCNPWHLEAVTSKENTLRGVGVAAEKARQTHCKRGHEFNQTNTMWRSQGGRECKQCRKDARASTKSWRSGKK